jgi:hypothetical protein
MMQSQGLGALMPQAAQQMAPQQADPQRLAAATNLVSSDAERQILDPRTLALIKYKDAIQAMQAADQMMAAAQPAPMPPTVAERTKLAAEQGIAGLASKLGAGIQQQGNNMQAQQMQQAMSGGLPQLPAPNMAGMAQGGIVGFQEGGRPEDTIIAYYSDGTPIYASEVARMDNAGAIDETPEGVERRARYAALQEAGQQGRADILGAARKPIEVAPAAQEPVAESRGRGGYGLDEMAIDAFGKIKSSVPGAMAGLAGLFERARGALPRIPEMSEEELLALTTSGGNPTRATAPTAPAPAVQTPRRQMDRVPESEALAAMSPSGPQTAAEYLMEYGQAPEAPEEQPRAGESAADRDARRRMLIAGLRGFGAQGLGGFAAGTAEEELRQEQEVIAEQERKRRAAMETRGLDLEERNITLQDAIRQQQLSQQQRADAEMLQYRYDQLNQRQQEAVDEAVNEETAMLRQALQALDSQIPNLKDGFFSSDLSDAVAQRESLVQQILAARARILEMYSGTQYGPAQTGQAGLAPEDDALVSEYLNR